MNKKILSGTVLLFFLVVLSCGGSFYAHREGHIRIPRKTQWKQEEEDNTVPSYIMRKTYELDTDHYEIEIYYPQLQGLDNLEKEKRINQLIVDHVKKILESNMSDDKEWTYAVSLDYEIKYISDKIISILYKGKFGYITAGKGLYSKAETITIDIEKERILSLDDVIDDYDRLSELLLDDRFEHITMWDGKAGNEKISEEYQNNKDILMECLKGTGYEPVGWYTDENHFIIISNYTIYYNEYSISHEVIKDILKKDYLEKFFMEKNEIQNPYFYQEGETKVEYEGYFYLHTYRDIWQDINLEINKLRTFPNGTLYTLELEELDVTDPLEEISNRRCLGYYYVTERDIYMFPASENGYTDARNNEIIMWIQENEEDFLKQAEKVCCEDGTEDITDKNDYHAYVKADGEKRVFQFYNDYFYGSKDYLLIVWEKGKGITYYVHGNGAKNMHIEFGIDLEQKQQMDYGYPYKMYIGGEE